MTGLMSAMLIYYSHYHLARIQHMNGTLYILSEKYGTNGNTNFFFFLLIILGSIPGPGLWRLLSLMLAFGHNVVSIFSITPVPRSRNS